MKKIIAVGLAVTAFAGVLAGCGGEETSSAGSTASGAVQGATKSTMVFADSQAPTHLDPAEGWNSWYTSRYGITETLFKLDKNLAA